MRLSFLILVLHIVSYPGLAANLSPTSFQLNDIYNVDVIGGYRFPPQQFGRSRVAYSPGPIAISDSEDIIYISGHSKKFSIGAFRLGIQHKLGAINTLPILSLYSPFVEISPQRRISNTADRVTGLEVLDKKLLVMTDEYYDADKNNRENLVIFSNRFELANSTQYGFFTLSGGSHIAGWMSKVPSPLAEKLGTIYLAGNASNLPINGRLSIGPSMFSWFPYFLEFERGNESILTTPLIDYSLESPLHDDLNNLNLANKLWTELSKAIYGFITPNQEHYMVLGTSGGHDSGIGYKIVQDNGNKCHGPCAFNHKDYYNYFWLYRTSDIREVLKGKKLPHEVRPEKYGKLDIFTHENQLIGADFNAKTKRLYLLFESVDKSQTSFESLPLLVVASLSDTSK